MPKASQSPATDLIDRSYRLLKSKWPISVTPFIHRRLSIELVASKFYDAICV